jgi:hypothetical protein
MRRPIDRNDGANGYVRLDMIDDARPTSKTTTRLFLTNGMAIDVEMPRPHVRARTRDARNSLILFKSRSEPYPL